MSDSIRQRLRRLRVLEGEFADFDIEASAATPQSQFLAWFDDALTADVPEPHAMVLSTCDEQGDPDARVLILKDIDEAGWHFATSNSSPKGQQLQGHPRAALTFYWQKLGRQVRIRGPVTALDREASEADFNQRSLGSRIAALVARQSDVLGTSRELDEAMSAQRATIIRDAQLTLAAWTVLVLNPATVEFWQADPERRHARLRYAKTPDGWSKVRLWP